MKKYLQIIIFTLLSLLVTFSCKNSTKNLMPAVTGKANEVLIIINTPLWKGFVGDTIRTLFSEEQIGLPQSEPLLDILNVPPKSFSGILKTYRNILEIKVSKKRKKGNISVKKGLWAKNQAYMKLEANSETETIKLIQKNRTKILSYFLSSEKERLIKIIKKKPVKNIFNKLKKEKKITISFLPGYTINKEFDDFLWISKETQKTSQGMFIYTFNYDSEEVFTKKYLLQKRDSILKSHVPGPSSGSYMTTEHKFPLSFRQFNFKKNYAVEMRGLWKVENDFMGGPFVNISFLDADKNRVICLDSYVYYPNEDKRNLLRELEAIMFTFEFVK